MLEGVDRLVDLVGPRSDVLSGGTDADILGAVETGNCARLADIDGHFAACARDGKTVRLARTIGLPLRYFVAKMYHGPFLVVSDRIDRLFDWCREQRISWQFEPAYTRMVPAHVLVEIDQVGCPDPSPRYRRFFEPAVGSGPTDLDEAGAAYVAVAYAGLKRWVAAVPEGHPIAVSFSGGVDSTSVLLLARKALEEIGSSPDRVRAFTLDFGGGEDAAQAQRTLHALGLEDSWERVAVSCERFDIEEAIRVIEDYHPLDVECAAAGLCLLRAIRERYPELRYLLDGDGGDENLKAYPLADSDLTLSSVLSNPLLYHEGWGVDALKQSLVYSGGLSRSYVRTFAPAQALGFSAFSPFTIRSVIAAALAIPVERVIEGREDRLYALKQDVVRSGMKRVVGIDMPINPKRRFQDGAHAAPPGRLTKAWCRRIFTRQWQERMAETELMDERRSGNEMVAG
jgi:asparagine synthase (glutamine-hydrolysing)